jgi:NAD+ diphosphatase
MVFVALNQPTDTEPGPAHWYVVRNGEVLTVGPGELPLGPAPIPDKPIRPSWPRPGGDPPIDLGVDPDTDPIFVGTMDGMACWALGVPAGTEAPASARWEGLRSLGASLPVEEWSAAGRAVHLVDWARTSRFCGRCGTATQPSPGERAMICPACGLATYPRVSPAVIVLVHRRYDGHDQVLLARNGNFMGRMFSVLAGFVEPGETLEATVHREIGEEVGVRLHDPKYVASQPWPFPHSLMVGFTAEWAGGEIEVDGQEIVEAGWYGRDELPGIPPKVSIARRLIDGWLASEERPDGAIADR